MADNKQYLHYDPNTKKLYIGDDCDTNPVYTLTSFQEGDLFVDENYRLNLRDVNGNTYVISESLKGDKGDKGDNGEDGKNGNNGIDTNAVFHLELSNDMDQIYVDADNKVVCDQTIWTDITLYNGSDIISDLTGSGWTLNATLGNTEYVSVVGRRISITFPKDAILDWKSGSSVCEIKASHKVDDIEVVKDFKIKRLQGTDDYDLMVSPGCIKVNDKGKPTTSEVSVKIKKRALGQTSSVEYISPNELPDRYSVTYKWIQSDKQSRSEGESKLQADTITLSDPVDSSKSLQIQLKYNSDTIDLANIEFVKDGKDGKIPKHLELSNDYDQLYVEDGKIKSAASYTINVQYFEGVTSQKISHKDVEITPNDDVYTVTKEQGKDDYTVKVIITPKTGNAFTEDPGTTLTIPIVYGPGITKNFTLVVLEGNTDYDLYVKPDVIKAYQDPDGNWVYDDSTFDVEVWSKTVGVVNSVPSKYDGIPEGYTVSCTVDGGQETEITTLSNINVPKVNDNGTRPNKISVQLTHGSTLVDWSELAILYDGTKGIKGDQGDKGDDGASAYYIDLSNDFDQLYNQLIDGVKTLLPNQSFETEVRLYKGSQLFPIPSTARFVCSKDSGSTNGIACSINTRGVGSVTINFSLASAENEEVTYAEITSTDLDQTSIAYKISLSGTIDGESIDLHKTVRITNITGTEDFDLKCNVTTIAKDSSGNLHDTRELPTFSVKCKDLLGTSASVVNYDTLAAIRDAGLTLKYTIDGTAPESATDYGDLPGILVSPDILNRTNEYLKVSLHKDGREIDYVLLDVILDGLPGQAGESVSQLVCTSGNIYTFYLNKEGHALQENQTWTPEFLFVSNDVSTTVSPSFSSSELVSDNVFIVSTEQTYEPGQYQIVCQYEENGKTYDTTLTINLVVGATYYDLKTTPAYIKYNPNTRIFDPVLIEVYSDCSGGGYSEESLYSLSPNSSLRLTIEDGDSNDSSENLTYNDGKATFNPQSTNTTTIKLIEEEDIKDFQILSVISDGTNGEIKTEIANEFLVEGIDDKLGTVVAGLTKDPVFFWGGGTKAEAEEKQTPLYFTTDGTGKVGVFEVGENDVKVKTNSGSTSITPELLAFLSTNTDSESTSWNQELNFKISYTNEEEISIASYTTLSDDLANKPVFCNLQWNVNTTSNPLPDGASISIEITNVLVRGTIDDVEVFKFQTSSGKKSVYTITRNSSGESEINSTQKLSWFTPNNLNNSGYIGNKSGNINITCTMTAKAVCTNLSLSNPSNYFSIKCIGEVIIGLTTAIISTNGVQYRLGNSIFEASLLGGFLRVVARGLTTSPSIDGELYEENGIVKIWHSN